VIEARGETDLLEGVHVLADDDPRWPRDPVEQARAACAGGASVIQLRAKHATDRRVLAWAEAIRALTTAAGCLFFLNDRFDLALAAGADGVHLGQEDLPTARLPRTVRARLRLGRSSHSLAEALGAAGEGADYVAFGPIFATTSKESPHAARGLEALAVGVARVAPVPVVAIGGIDAARAPALARIGARGIAVISAVAGAADPLEATAELVNAFRETAP
jgi:thiamine-phosphate pyrophosphorylase